MTRLKRLLGLIVVLVMLFLTFAAGWIVAVTGIGSVLDPSSAPDSEPQFAQRAQNVALAGSFTVT